MFLAHLKLVLSCGGLWCLLVLLLLEKKRDKKKRSGQAGLLVPKAATTARESLKHPKLFPLSPPRKRENVLAGMK